MAFYEASQFYTLSLDNFTFEEMQFSGNLALIRDIELRKELADYYDVGDKYSKLFWESKSEYRKDIRGLIPMKVLDYLFENCKALNSNKVWELKSCPSILTGSEERQLLARIIEMEHLLDNLRYWLNDRKIAESLAVYQFEFSESLIMKIKNKLEG